MPLTRVIATTQKIKSALANEVERARGERRLVKTLDGALLMERAALRDGFNTTLASYERELQHELAAVATTLGLDEVTLKALSAHGAEQAAVWSDALAEVRALSSALSELDAFNRVLAERTLGIVRGYVAAVVPRPTAYDRSGLRPAMASGATHSTRV